jgi:hypothetical protein
MHISSKQKYQSRRTIIIVVVVLFLLTGGALAYWYCFMRSDTSFVETEITNTQESGESPEKVEVADDELSDSEVTNEKTVTVPSNTTAGTVQPVITFASEDGGKISLGSYLPTAASGECKLVLSKNGAADIVKTTPVRMEAQYICQFWDIAVPSPGGWTAKLTNVNGANESEPATMKVR